jgi:hypothetical protein
MLKGLVKQVLAVPPPDVVVSPAELGFKPPELQDIITFLVRFLFVVAGLAALLYLLLGAISWITAGGNKESVDKAREKIQNAVIGLILVFVVLAIVVLLERIIFPTDCGLGISKKICIPSLVRPP